MKPPINSNGPDAPLVLNRSLIRRRSSDDPLANAVSRMQNIALITNGIYFNQGFTKGSVPPEEFISKRLHIKTLEKTELEKLQKDLSVAKETLGKLTKSTDEDKIENRYTILAQIAEVAKGLKGTVSLEGKDDYKNEVKRLSAAQFDLNMLVQFQSALSTFFGLAEKLNSQSHDVAKDNISDRTTILSLINDFANSIQPLKDSSDLGIILLEITDNIQNPEKVFNPITILFKCMDIYNAGRQTIVDLGSDSEAIASNKKNFHLLDQLSSLAKDVNFVGIRNIFQARNLGESVFSLKELPEALKDPWVQSIIKDVDYLSTTMEQLIGLEPIVSSADNFLGADKLTIFDDIDKDISAILPFGATVKSLLPALDSMNACFEKTLAISSVANDIKELVEKIGSLKVKANSMVKLTGVAYHLFSKNADLDKINGLSTISDMSTALVNVDATLKNLKESKEFQEMLTFLSSPSKHVDAIQLSAKPSIQEIATEILQKLSKLDNFQTTFKNHIQAFQCSQTDPNFSLIPSAVQTLQTYRQMSLKAFDSGLETIGNLLKASGKIDELVTAIQKMNGLQNDLPELENAQKHSEAIGIAASEIKKMNRLIDSKEHFEKVLTNSKTDDEVRKMFESLTTWMGTVKLPESEKLEDYSNIFIEAQKVTGISDIRALIDDLMKRPMDPKDLNAVITSLEQNGLLDSHQQLGDSPDALKALDLFFTALNTKLHPTTTEEPTSTAADPETSTSSTLIMDVVTMEALIASTTLAPSIPWKTIIIVAFVAVGIIVIAGGIICFVKKRRGSVPKSNDEGKKDVVVIPSPSITDTTNIETPVKQEAESGEKDKVGKNSKEGEAGGETKKTAGGEGKEQNLIQNPTNEGAGGRKIIALTPLPVNSGEWILHQLDNMMKTLTPQEGNLLLLYSSQIYKTLVEMIPLLRDKIREEEARQNRYQISLQPQTRVYLKELYFTRCFHSDDYLNANCVEMPNGHRFFLTESPLITTCPKFLFMLIQTNSTAVVMLGSEDEVAKKKDRGLSGYYFPKDGEKLAKFNLDASHWMGVTCEEEQVHEHFIHRKLKITVRYMCRRKVKTFEEAPKTPATESTWEDKTKVMEMDVEKKPEPKKEEPVPTKAELERRRKIEDQRRGDGRQAEEARKRQQYAEDGETKMFESVDTIEFNFDQYQIVNWPEDSIPGSTDGVIQVLERVQNVPNVVVHCSDGVGRSGTFACCEYARQSLSLNMAKEENQRPQAVVVFPHLLQHPRTCRNGAIRNEKHVALILMALVDMAYKVKNPKLGRYYKSKYQRLKDMYKNIFDSTHEIPEKIELDVTVAFEEQAEIKRKTPKPKPKPEVKTTVVNEFQIQKTQEDSKTSKKSKKSGKSKKDDSSLKKKEDKTQPLSASDLP